MMMSELRRNLIVFIVIVTLNIIEAFDDNGQPSTTVRYDDDNDYLTILNSS